MDIDPDDYDISDCRWQCESKSSPGKYIPCVVIEPLVNGRVKIILFTELRVVIRYVHADRVVPL